MAAKKKYPDDTGKVVEMLDTVPSFLYHEGPKITRCTQFEDKVMKRIIEFIEEWKVSVSL
jgi:hypothetical protein